MFIFLRVLLFILLFYFTFLFLKNCIAHGCTVNEIFIDWAFFIFSIKATPKMCNNEIL